MQKRIAITVSFITLVLVISLTSLRQAESAAHGGDVAANIIAANGSPTGASVTSGKRGNGFTRALGAPFKAIAKLFGRGKDDGKLHRMTEKDAAKFQSVGLARVDDNNSVSARAARDKKSKKDVEQNSATRAEAVTAGVTLMPSSATRNHLAEGRALLENGQLNEAIAELSLASSLDPRSSEADNLLGVAFDRKGLPERAQQAYARSLRIAPKDAQTLNNFGYSLYMGGNYRSAVERLKRATKLAPNDQRVLNNLALAQSRLGKYDDAFKSFARADGEFTGHLNVATLLERAGRDDDALTHYEAARRLQPDSIVVLRRLVDLYQKTDRPDKAETALRAMTAPGSSTIAATGVGK